MLTLAQIVSEISGYVDDKSDFALSHHSIGACRCGLWRCDGKILTVFEGMNECSGDWAVIGANNGCG